MCAENPTALHNTGKRKKRDEGQDFFPSRVAVSRAAANSRTTRARLLRNASTVSVSGVIMESGDRVRHSP